MINKNDIIRATKDIVAEQLEGITLKDTTVFVEAMLKAIENGLVSDGKIRLFGFGDFKISERAERMGRNPKTGEECLIPATKTIKFKASKALKDTINSKDGEI